MSLNHGVRWWNWVSDRIQGNWDKDRHIRELLHETTSVPCKPWGFFVPTTQTYCARRFTWVDDNSLGSTTLTPTPVNIGRSFSTTEITSIQERNVPWDEIHWVWRVTLSYLKVDLPPLWRGEHSAVSYLYNRRRFSVSNRQLKCRDIWGDWVVLSKRRSPSPQCTPYIVVI